MRAPKGLRISRRWQICFTAISIAAVGATLYTVGHAIIGDTHAINLDTKVVGGSIYSEEENALKEEFVPDESGSGLSTQGSLPSTYNSQDKYTVATKNQNSEGLCWLYATATTIEYSTRALLGTNYSISPKHMDYQLVPASEAYVDEDVASGATNPVYDFYGLSRHFGTGGQPSMALTEVMSPSALMTEHNFDSMLYANDSRLHAATFTSYEDIWTNPAFQWNVLEYTHDDWGSEYLAYTKKQKYSDINDTSKSINYMVTGAHEVYYPHYGASSAKTFIVNVIKMAIMDTGAAMANTLWDSENCVYSASVRAADGTTDYYHTLIDRGPTYCDTSTGHVVTLVGWDDDWKYGDKTGAFIVQNSWGNEETEHYYMSYESLIDVTYFDGYDRRSDYDHIYSVESYKGYKGEYIKNDGTVVTNIDEATMKTYNFSFTTSEEAESIQGITFLDNQSHNYDIYLIRGGVQTKLSSFESRPGITKVDLSKANAKVGGDYTIQLRVNRSESSTYHDDYSRPTLDVFTDHAEANTVDNGAVTFKDSNLCNALSEMDEVTENGCGELVPYLKIKDEGFTSHTSFMLWDENITSLDGIENFTSLTHLNVSGNNITDLSPLSKLTNLEQLSLYRNNIKDVSPLKNLTNLTNLWLDKNQITDISPLKSLTKLVRLYVGENQISDISALEQSWPSLDTLWLDGNKISDVSTLSKMSAPQLRWLVLQNNQISDISPLANLTSVSILSLGYNKVSDVSALKSLTNLGQLYLNNNSITDASSLSKLTKLGRLDLSHNGLSSSNGLEKMSSLNYLDVSYNKLSSVSSLASSSAKTVIANGNPATDLNDLGNKMAVKFASADLCSGAAAAAKRYELSITDSCDSESILQIKAKDIKKIAEITVNDKNVTSLEGIEVFTGLIVLELNYNNITDISPLAALANNLKYLGLNGNDISDISVLSKLTKLDGLGLSGNTKIDDISALAPLTKLATLDLWYLPISDISVLSGMKDIYALYLGDNKISDISALKDMTKMQILTIDANQVTDISPLANMTEMFSLRINNNKIKDISALSKMTKLKYLNLSKNQISDFSPALNLNIERLFGADANSQTITIDTTTRKFSSALLTQSVAMGGTVTSSNANFDSEYSGMITDTSKETTVYISGGTFDGSVVTVNYIGKSVTEVAEIESITGVRNGAAKTTAALGLPETVTIKLDDGTTTSAQVSWDVDNADYDVNSTQAQTFTVEGTLVLPGGINNDYDLGLTVSVEVQVLADSTDAEAQAPTGSTDPTDSETQTPTNAATQEISFLQGRNYKIGSGEDLIMRIDYPLDMLERVTIDNATVSGDNYDLRSGSTIITLHADYLDTLETGEHTLQAVYNDGTVLGANFTVIRADKELSDINLGVPDTGTATESGTGAAMTILAPIIIVVGIGVGRYYKRWRVYTHK